jgi:hypothetical protein
MKPVSAFPILRQLPLRPKLPTVLNRLETSSIATPTRGASEEVISYPDLSSDAQSVVPKPGATLMLGDENSQQIYQPNRFHATIRADQQAVCAHRLSPSPSNREDSFFKKSPQIANAQIVAMDEIILPICQLERLSSSSASWTGDSQFYMPQHKILPLPTQERKSSVPEWLEQLPVEPEEFEKAEESSDDDEKGLVPLSPHVRLERGSMRRNLRDKGTRKRCQKFGEESVI